MVNMTKSAAAITTAVTRYEPDLNVFPPFSWLLLKFSRIGVAMGCTWWTCNPTPVRRKKLRVSFTWEIG